MGEEDTVALASGRLLGSNYDWVRFGSGLGNVHHLDTAYIVSRWVMYRSIMPISDNWKWWREYQGHGRGVIVFTLVYTVIHSSTIVSLSL
jgi:hypothetical protein